MENKLNNSSAGDPGRGRSLIQFIKFALVGVLNTLVDMVVFYVLVNFAGLPEIPAQIISYTCGVLNSYLFNSKWTFKAEHRKSFKEFALFVVVNLITLGVSLGILYLCTNVIFADGVLAEKLMGTFLSKFVGDAAKMNRMIGKVIATPLTIIFNFILNKIFVFKGKKEEGKA